MSEKAKLADLSVVESLQQAARHRIMQVQLAAARALKAWKEERDESPKSHGLTVSLLLFSPCKRSERVSRRRGPSPKRRGRRWRTNSPS
jgi:hypothetical protein